MEIGTNVLFFIMNLYGIITKLKKFIFRRN